MEKGFGFKNDSEDSEEDSEDMDRRGFIFTVAYLFGPCLALLGALVGSVYLTKVFGGEREEWIEPISYRIERHDVDQVFRDHNGYRVYYNNSSGEVVEKKYYEDGIMGYGDSEIPLPIIEESDLFRKLEEGNKHVRIFRDLDEGEQGYANVLHYNARTSGNMWDGPPPLNGEEHLFYLEMHLPENQGLSPGKEVYGGKFPVRDIMSEIE